MKKILMICLSLLCLNFVFAQSDEGLFIHNWLQENGGCKNGVVTDTSGYVVIAGSSIAAWSAKTPLNLTENLQIMYDNNQDIDDICITEEGKWFIVGDQVTGDGAPQSMYNKIDEMLNRGERIKSVTFNDFGQWIIISDKNFFASDKELQKFLQKTKKQHGVLNSACMTNTALIVVGTEGYCTKGVLPQQLLDFLNDQLDYAAEFIKFSDQGAYLVTDGYSRCNYNLY